MKGLIIGLGIVVLIVWIIASWFLGVYNGLVAQSGQVDGRWAEVEAQHQRRFDLVPNLVASTQGALVQEQEVFGAIAEARTRYTNAPAGTNERVQATQQYESALARLMVIVENYPQLRSLETVSRLMDELAGTENRILISRTRYNESVKDYNVQIKTFPTMLLAGMYGFGPREFFQPSEGSEVVPTVDLTT